MSQMWKTICGRPWSQSAPKIVQSHASGPKQPNRQHNSEDKIKLNLNSSFLTYKLNLTLLLLFLLLLLAITM